MAYVVAALLLFSSVLLWLKMDALHAQLEDIMAAIDDAATATQERVTALEGKVNETIVTLQELKALVGSGNTANAEAILAQANAKLDELLTNLGTAETDADPTPDA